MKMVFYRLGSFLILLISLFVFPWWLTYVLLLLGICLFPFYYEAVVIGLMIDALYGTFGSGINHVWSALILMILIPIVSYLKRRIVLH